MGEPLFVGVGDAKLTFICLSFVTKRSETGTSVGCVGKPANMTKVIPLRVSLCVVITLIWNLKVKPYVPVGKLVTFRLFKLGRFLTRGS